MTRTLIHALIGLLAAACALPTAAGAGGWATVGLEPMPDRVGPGEAWVVDLTVLQHGRTPLEGVHPTLTIRETGGATRTFRATATGRAGVYRARVIFPSAGTYRYEVNDDFSAVHRFGPVRIGAAAPAPVEPSGGAGGLPIALPLAAALLAGLLGAWALRRRLRPAAG